MVLPFFFFKLLLNRSLKSVIGWVEDESACQWPLQGKKNELEPRMEEVGSSTMSMSSVFLSG